MPGIIVDIGTGDGKFTYQMAKENPDRFIIGIDPAQKGLEKVSAKIYQKPARGGLKNALFVLADVESLPEELNGLANQVFINFPWSSLLKGIILVEDKTWHSIKRICQKGAIIDLVLGYDEISESDKLNLPKFDSGYIKKEMAPKLVKRGFEFVKIKELTNKDLKAYPSSWAKKLGFGKERQYFYIRLKVH